MSIIQYTDLQLIQVSKHSYSFKFKKSACILQAKNYLLKKGPNIGNLAKNWICRPVSNYAETPQSPIYLSQLGTCHSMCRRLISYIR